MVPLLLPPLDPPLVLLLSQVNKQQLLVVKQRFLSFLNGETQMLADEAFCNAVRSYYEVSSSLLMLVSVSLCHFLPLPATPFHFLSFPSSLPATFLPFSGNFFHFLLPPVTYRLLGSLCFTFCLFLSLPATSCHFPSLPATSIHILPLLATCHLFLPLIKEGGD